MKDLSRKMRILRNIARMLFAMLAVFWFGFALFSGSEGYGGGLKGILMNSPNALPWLVLFVFVWIVWNWELLGGALIALSGLFSIFFFNALESPFVLLVISFPLIFLGGIFIASWYFLRNKQ